jgi:cellulose synthase operon protein C
MAAKPFLNTARSALASASILTFLLASTALPLPAFAQRNNSLAEAQAFFNRGDIRSANTVLRNVLRDNPNNGAARVLAARVALAAGNGAGAQAEIDRARAAGIARDSTRTLMAEALFLQRRLKEAREEIATGVPANFAGEGARLSGLLLLADNKRAEGLAELVRAETLQPRDVRTKIDLSRAYAFNRDLKKAEATIDQALALSPRDVRAILIKGDLVRGTRGLQAGLPFFDQAIQIDQQSLEARLERAATLVDLQREREAREELARINKLVPQGHPLSLYLEAVLQARKKEYQEAQALMQRTRGTLDNYPPAVLLQGIIALETNNLSQAVSFLNKAVQANPNNPIAQRMLGAAQLRSGDVDGALKTLEPLAQAAQKDARLLALIGTAYARKNDYDNAAKFLEQAVQLEPKANEIRSQLAMARVALGQNAQAMQDLQVVLRSDPKSLQALTMTTLVDLRSRNFQTALASAQRLVKTYPESPLSHNMLAAAYVGLQRFKEAEASFRTALQKKPDYHEARRNLAQMYASQKRYDETRRELLIILEAQPQSARTLLALADVEGLQNRRADQLQYLRRAVTAEPRNFVARVALVNTLLTTGDTKRGLEEANAMEKDFGNNPAAIETLGLALIQARQYDRAVTNYQRLVTIQPTSIPAHMLLARAQRAANKFADARRTYQKALGLKPQALQQRGILLVDLMGFEASQGQFDTALSYASELRKSFPNQNVVDATLGDLYSGAKRWREAAQAYEAAAKSGAGINRAIAINLSRAYQNMNEPERAANALRLWLKRQPNDAPVQLQVANVLLEGNRFPQAIAEYERIRAAGNNSPAILNNLAFAYNKINDPRARALAEQAYRAAPKSPEIADTLGWILVQRNIDPKRGLTLLRQSSAQLKNNPDAQYHLAFALRANGQNAEAVRVLEALLANNRSFPALADARALLSQLRAQRR